jgi:hypothetical protein
MYFFAGKKLENFDDFDSKHCNVGFCENRQFLSPKIASIAETGFYNIDPW